MANKILPFNLTKTVEKDDFTESLCKFVMDFNEKNNPKATDIIGGLAFVQHLLLENLHTNVLREEE